MVSFLFPCSCSLGDVSKLSPNTILFLLDRFSLNSAFCLVRGKGSIKNIQYLPCLYSSVRKSLHQTREWLELGLKTKKKTRKSRPNLKLYTFEKLTVKKNKLYLKSHLKHVQIYRYRFSSKLIP